MKCNLSPLRTNALELPFTCLHNPFTDRTQYINDDNSARDNLWDSGIPAKVITGTDIKFFYSQYTLKLKCYFNNILIIGGIKSRHFDNFRCHQWWKFCQNDNISIQCKRVNLSLSPEPTWEHARCEHGIAQHIAMSHRKNPLVLYHSTIGMRSFWKS